ncbi:uncharacterized protein BX663DRAFT_526850 [Cokeromyces recurvatus]|uniref:uncharacterized protein n=1 Tax=Cokeromyces recurvatus TaxID=90255 RepID=UPI0022208F90|nr:uncharacterized protein BX663DRAFT_526850 [Cokeromyces recurvatus]KAI7897900.1 hypothetical protein BX663DRAFT_526850 [Cokeromyces recurvatus]
MIISQKKNVIITIYRMGRGRELTFNNSVFVVQILPFNGCCFILYCACFNGYVKMTDSVFLNIASFYEISNNKKTI